MRGLARLTGHESCMRIEENYKRLAVCTLQLQGSTKWPMFLSVFSDTREKPEASDVQVITHNKKKKKRKYVSSTRDSCQLE